MTAYNVNDLISNIPKKVYDTVIITMMGAKVPTVQKCPSEAHAISFAKMIVKDWCTMPNTSYNIIDQYNIMLIAAGTNAILITRDFDVIEATLTQIQTSIDSWGK